MKPILTIAIPTYNNPQQLAWCLRSLVLHTEYPFKIVVVNNDPNKEGNAQVEYIASTLNVPHMIEVIHAGTNMKWMGALNMVLGKTETPFFCSLNDDVVFLPSDKIFWRKLMNYFSDPSIGAVGPCSNFVAGCQNLFALEIPPVIKTSLLIGFCKIIRTQLLKDIGGYDEILPGGDDLDTSIRIVDSGYTLLCDRTVYLHHIGQQTGRRLHSDWDSREHQERTNNALIKKHGLKKWYTCFMMGWEIYKSAYNIENLSIEDEWYSQKIIGFEPKTGLNVGCGDKPLNGAINIDIAPKDERGSGARKFSDSDPDIVADARKLPYEPCSVKYICAAHILEHLLDPVSVLREWRRVLDVGGMLFMTLPNHDLIPTIALDYTHVHAYNPETIKNLLQVTGWVVESIEKLSGGNFGIIARKPSMDFEQVKMDSFYSDILKKIRAGNIIPEEQVLLNAEEQVLLNDGN